MTDMDESNDSEEMFMQELKQEFMESTVEHLKIMPELYRENNFAEIARIAHDIKGTSGIFGLAQGTDIAKDLQKAAQEEKAGEIKNLLDQLTAYMKENGIIP